MKELRNKQEAKRALYSLPSLAILALAVFLLARGAGAIVLKERESAQTLAALRDKNAELESKEAALQEDIARLQTDEGKIEEIRKKFNVTRPGEHLAIVVEETPAPAASSSGALEKLKHGWEWFLSLWGK